MARKMIQSDKEGRKTMQDLHFKLLELKVEGHNDISCVHHIPTEVQLVLYVLLLQKYCILYNYLWDV